MQNRNPTIGPLLATVLAIALLAPSGCDRGATPGGPQAGSGPLEAPIRLRLGRPDRPLTLDPAAVVDSYGTDILANVFDTLYRYRYLARPVELVPSLAAAMPDVSDDGLRYRIRLRPGVNFSDDPAFPGGVGRELVADDVVYSVKRHFRPTILSKGRFIWQNHLAGIGSWIDAGADIDEPFAGVRAVDETTVEFVLSAPYPQFVFLLAHSLSSIVAREADSYYGENVGDHPVGSGPFLVASVDSARIVLQRNPGFRDERLDLAAEGFEPARHGPYGLEAVDGRKIPLVDEIVVETLAGNSVLWQSYLKGDELDIAGVPQALKAAVLGGTVDETTRERIAAHHLAAGPTLAVRYIAFNMADPTIGDVGTAEARERRRALRCAIRDSYDWDARVAWNLGGLARVFPGIIHPALPEFDPELPRTSVTVDRERARSRLAAHGWNAENLPELSFGDLGSLSGRRVFEEWRSGLIEIGYPAERIGFRSFSGFGPLSQALAEGSVPIMSLGWRMDYPDAENLLQLFYGPNAAPGPNSANYRDPVFDRLFEQWRQSPPGSERTAAFRSLNERLIDACVLIGTVAPVDVVAWRPEVIAYADPSIVGGFRWRYYGRQP